MKIGFLCPGQASQKVGMGLDLYERSELGKKFFDIANEIMDIDIQKIIFDGPDNPLFKPEGAQEIRQLAYDANIKISRC